MSIKKNNLNITDINHSVAINETKDIIYISNEFFNKYKDILSSIKNKQDLNKLDDEYELIKINEKYNNLDTIMNYLNKDTKCSIKIENIDIDEEKLNILKNQHMNIIYVKNNKKTTISTKYAILEYTYDDLEKIDSIFINNDLSEEEISKL